MSTNSLIQWYFEDTIVLTYMFFSVQQSNKDGHNKIPDMSEKND